MLTKTPTRESSLHSLATAERESIARRDKAFKHLRQIISSSNPHHCPRTLAHHIMQKALSSSSLTTILEEAGIYTVNHLEIFILYRSEEPSRR